MNKKVVVIGGGIAGLNAGIELLQHGYDVDLYEKNDEVGGLCSGYFVDGYSIDACFHWLMGTKPHTVINNLWRNLDALNDDVPVSHLQNFCTFEYRGTTVTFSRSLEEEEARWLALSPQDQDAIKTFFACVRGLASVWNLTQAEKHPRPDMNLIKMLPNSSRILHTMKLSREEYAKKFVHPALRFALKNAMTGYNNAFFFLQVYGLFSTGDGDVPLGGAYPFVQRIKNRFLSLGGRLHLNTPVDELLTEGRHVKAARIGKEEVKADYFIATTDPNYALKHLLGGQYQSHTYSKINKRLDDYTISSCFCVYLKVKDYQGDIATPTCILMDKVKVGKKKVDALLVRPYDFDTLARKEDAAVISLFIDQEQHDYEYFAKLKDPKAEQDRIVNDLVQAFLKAYPQYKDKTSVLDSFGPLDLHAQTNTSFGSIQSYSFTDKGSFYMHKGKLSALDNLYLCGQWSRSIGGTPTALLSSHDIVNKLLRHEKWLALDLKRIIKK